MVHRRLAGLGGLMITDDTVHEIAERMAAVPGVRTVTLGLT